MMLRLISSLFVATFCVSVEPRCVLASSHANTFIVHDCPSAWAWFGKEPGYKVTLMSAGAGPGTYPAPKTPDNINVNFRQARHYYTTFGRGCLGGFYDASHRIAALYAWHENYDDTVVSSVQQPVSGFTSSTLQSVRTARGVTLGSTVQGVEAIEGRGTHVPMGSGASLVRYEWHQAMRGTGVKATLYLTFLFERNRLIAMGLGKRV